MRTGYEVRLKCDDPDRNSGARQLQIYRAKTTGRVNAKKQSPKEEQCKYDKLDMRVGKKWHRLHFIKKYNEHKPST